MTLGLDEIFNAQAHIPEENMSEEKGTLFTVTLVLIAIVFLGGVFGGISLFLRRPVSNLGKPAYSASSQSSRSTQDDALEAAQADFSKAEMTADDDSFETVEGAPTGVFNYGGSTTWAPLRQKEASALHSIWPDFQLRYTAPGAEPPGSGTGISMLLVGQLAFSQSSRPIKPEEYEEAKQRGFILEQIPVAIDGIAIAVNPVLDIPGLTLNQLKAIYTSKITNWSELKGPDTPIIPFSRSPEAGGTPEFFVGNVLGNEALGSTVKLVDDTTQGLREVAANPGGIYYASSPEVVPQCSTKPIPIAQNSDEPFVPPYQVPLISSDDCPNQRNQLNIAVFRNGEYPLTRRLFVIVKKDGSLDQLAGEAYARLILTDRGQQLVREAGFVNIR